MPCRSALRRLPLVVRVEMPLGGSCSDRTAEKEASREGSNGSFTVGILERPHPISYPSSPSVAVGTFQVPCLQDSLSFNVPRFHLQHR